MERAESVEREEGVALEQPGDGRIPVKRREPHGHNVLLERRLGVLGVLAEHLERQAAQVAGLCVQGKTGAEGGIEVAERT